MLLFTQLTHQYLLTPHLLNFRICYSEGLGISSKCWFLVRKKESLNLTFKFLTLLCYTRLLRIFSPYLSEQLTFFIFQVTISIAILFFTPSPLKLWYSLKFENFRQNKIFFVFISLQFSHIEQLIKRSANQNSSHFSIHSNLPQQERQVITNYFLDVIWQFEKNTSDFISL